MRRPPRSAARDARSATRELHSSDRSDLVAARACAVVSRASRQVADDDCSRTQRSSHSAQQPRTAGHCTAREQGHTQIVPDAGWSPTGSTHGGDRRSGQRGAQTGTSRHLGSPANRTRRPRAPSGERLGAGGRCVEGLLAPASRASSWTVASRVRQGWRLASPSSWACCDALRGGDRNCLRSTARRSPRLQGEHPGQDAMPAAWARAASQSCHSAIWRGLWCTVPCRCFRATDPRAEPEPVAQSTGGRGPTSARASA